MGEKHAQIIVLANQKGGCGKSTTAVNLAAGFAHLGHQATLVDLDSQCNTTGTFGIVPEELKQEGRYTIADAFLANKPATRIEIVVPGRFEGRLSIIPGHRSLDQVQAQLDADLKRQVIADGYSPLDEDEFRAEHRLRLKKSLGTLSEQRDFIVIDTPPRLGFELTAALLAADWYLIPVFPSLYDVDGLSRLTSTVKKVRQRGNPKLRLLGVVLGNFKLNTNLHHDVRKKLKANFPDTFCDTVITESVRHGEATFRRQTIYEHAPSHTSAQQFEALTRELLSRLVPETNELAASEVEVSGPRSASAKPVGGGGEPVAEEVAANE